MFDDPPAIQSDWHDSTALGKYLFVPLMCNNSFCRVKFPNCLKHNISIQMSIQSINDEWWVYIYLWIPIIVITFLSVAQPMKLGTNSPNLCHQKMQIILFWTWRTYRKLVLYTKVKLTSNLFFLNCTYPRNVHIIKVIPTILCPCPIYKVQTIFGVHTLFCD